MPVGTEEANGECSNTFSNSQENTFQKVKISQKLYAVRSSIWFITLVVATIVWTDNFLYGIIIPVTPTILNKRLGIKHKDVQYYTSLLLGIYGAAVLVGSPIFGHLADRSSCRRNTLFIGFVSLAASMVMFHLSGSIWLLIMSRIFQGLSAAVVFSAGLALLTDTIPAEKSGRAMGYVNMSLKMAIISGPALGGVVYQAGGDTALFGLAYVIIALDVLMRFLVVEKRKTSSFVSHSSNDELPYGRGEASMGTSEADSLGRNQITSWRNSTILILLCSGRFATALFGWFMIGVILTAFDTTLPIFVHSTFGWNTSGAGLIMMPLLIPELAAPLVGWVIDRHPKSPRILAGSGFLLSAIFFNLLRLVNHDTSSQRILLMMLLLLLGCCLTLCGPTLMSEVSRIVPYIEMENPIAFKAQSATGLAYGLYNSAIAAGQLAGPFIFGWIKEAFGWPTMGLILGISSGISGVLMTLCLGGWIGLFLQPGVHDSPERERLIPERHQEF